MDTHQRNRFFSRFLGLFLSLCLSAPASVFGLRAGIEGKTKAGLERGLQSEETDSSAAGLEEGTTSFLWPRERAGDWLVLKGKAAKKMMEELKKTPNRVLAKLGRKWWIEGVAEGITAREAPSPFLVGFELVAIDPATGAVALINREEILKAETVVTPLDHVPGEPILYTSPTVDIQNTPAGKWLASLSGFASDQLSKEHLRLIQRVSPRLEKQTPATGLEGVERGSVTWSRPGEPPRTFRIVTEAIDPYTILVKLYEGDQPVGSVKHSYLSYVEGGWSELDRVDLEPRYRRQGLSTVLLATFFRAVEDGILPNVPRDIGPRMKVFVLHPMLALSLQHFGFRANPYSGDQTREMFDVTVGQASQPGDLVPVYLEDVRALNRFRLVTSTSDWDGLTTVDQRPSPGQAVPIFAWYSLPTDQIEVFRKHLSEQPLIFTWYPAASAAGLEEGTAELKHYDSMEEFIKTHRRILLGEFGNRLEDFEKLQGESGQVWDIPAASPRALTTVMTAIQADREQRETWIGVARSRLESVRSDALRDVYFRVEP